MTERMRTFASRSDDFEIDLIREGDERRLEVSMRIHATPEEVWKAITEAEEIVNWFSFECKASPGVGGEIELIWAGHATQPCVIREWQPGERLVTSWEIEDPASGEPVDTILEYRLEGRSGETRLHVVHSGFSADESWDGIVDDHAGGWSFELRSLRHYLEHHARQRRRMVSVSWAEGGDADTAWERLFGAGGLLAEADLVDLSEGQRYQGRSSTGEELEGRLLLSRRPTDLAATVESLDDSLLRVHIGQWSESEPVTLRLWLFCWQLAEEKRRAIEEGWRRALSVEPARA